MAPETLADALYPAPPAMPEYVRAARCGLTPDQTLSPPADCERCDWLPLLL